MEVSRRSLAALVAAAAVAGCGGEDDVSRHGAATVTDPVSQEQALELIRACAVGSVGASHGGEAEITFEGGRTLSIADPHVEALFEAAAEAQERSCDIEMYTE